MLALCLTASVCFPELKLGLQPGDRIVWLGGTLIEREQRDGYWEAALTAAYAEAKVTYRNLAWSGDTVWGEARAAFDTAKEGYQRLLAQTRLAKPTAIVLGYGGNEAFAGEAGLADFIKQYDRLLTDVSAITPRLALLAPAAPDPKRWPRATLDSRRREIERYSAAIEQLAGRRGANFLADPTAGAPTDNGLHLTPAGYAKSAPRLLTTFAVATPKLTLTGTDAQQLALRVGATAYRVQVPDAPAGRSRLMLDGQAIQTASAREWHQGIDVPMNPTAPTAEKLRVVIVRKNELFFHRWRPHNETYLFGFRKHEQGQNAKEMPEFEPLIAALEVEIAKLSQSEKHEFRLEKVD